MQAIRSVHGSVSISREFCKRNYPYPKDAPYQHFICVIIKTMLTASVAEPLPLSQIYYDDMTSIATLAAQLSSEPPNPINSLIGSNMKN
jgi:hypothetical protein